MAEDLLDREAAEVRAAGEAGTSRRARRRSAAANRWARLFHVYVSMFCMLVVAFFAFTGLTLNHPTWSLGSTTTTTATGTVPAGAIQGSDVDFLVIAEYARDEFDVSGHVKDHALQGDSGYIDFAGPGYSASVRFSTVDSTLEVSTTQSDLLAVLNDVHKARDTDSSWGWVVDGSAVLLLGVTLTGVAIQIFQPRRRRSALITAGLLSLVTIGLVVVAIS